LEELQEQQQQQLAALGTVVPQLCRDVPAAVDSLAADTVLHMSSLQQQGLQAQPRAATSSSSSSTGQAQAACGPLVVQSSARAGAAPSEVYPLIGVGEDALPCWWAQELPCFLAESLTDARGCCGSAVQQLSSSSSGIAHQHNLCYPAGVSSQGAGMGATAVSGSVDAPCWQPAWLHGDVMSGNVLLQLDSSGAALDVESTEQDRAVCYAVCASSSSRLGLKSVALLDFADAGIGDPLYDFVALFASVFDCEVALLRTAMQSYCSSRSGAFVCDDGPGGVLQLRPAGNCCVGGSMLKGSAVVNHGSSYACVRLQCGLSTLSGLPSVAPRGLCWPVVGEASCCQGHAQPCTGGAHLVWLDA
jgi:hypothetical protein